MREQEGEEAPRFEFGGPCPKIKPIFFPFDEGEVPHEIEEIEGHDSAQSS